MFLLLEIVSGHAAQIKQFQMPVLQQFLGHVATAEILLYPAMERARFFLILESQQI